MSANVERVLERGERLDTLVDRTTDLEASVGFLSFFFVIKSFVERRVFTFISSYASSIVLQECKMDNNTWNRNNNNYSCRYTIDSL
jgi:hypothetical protein